MIVKNDQLTPYVNGGKLVLKKELIVFSLLAAILSWSVIVSPAYQVIQDFPIGNKKALEELFGSLIMLYGMGPLISAVIVTLIYRKLAGLKELLKRVVEWRVPFRWYILVLVFPVISQWIGLVAWGWISRNEIHLPALSEFFSSWIQITLISAAYYITEELGWRGFMLPRFLPIHSWLKASFITGIIWTVWHYPLWITSSWATSGSINETVLMVAGSTMITIGISVLITKVFVRTNGSVLLAMLYHGSSQANLSKMYAAAGDISLTSSSFIITQAVILSITVGLFLLLTSRGKLGDETKGSVGQPA